MPTSKLTLLLKGGTVFDGRGSAPYVADVGISGDEISYIGKGPVHAERVLDITGLAVSPGFIDVHAHSEFTLLADPRAQGKLFQGVTTEVNGNCGLSAGPLRGEARARREEDLKEYGISERWDTLAEYLTVLERRGLILNFATLAGHGSIRASVVGYADRKPSEKEMDSMKRLLRETMNSGAIGLSTGLIYPPGIYSGPEEIIELASFGRETSERFIYTSHMRSEGDRLLEAIDETIGVGAGAGVSVHISHIKTAGKKNWHKAGKALTLMEGAREKGIKVTCDRYPYTAGSTDLDAVLPAWAFEGGAEAETKRLENFEIRARIKNELPPEEDCWEGVVISSVPGDSGKWLEGLSIKDIALRKGMECRDALLDVLSAEGLRVGAIFHGMSEENLWTFLSLPYSMVASDSSVRSYDGPTAKGKPHPRGFGTFPRFLKNYPGEMSEAIYKATAFPAETFGLKGRGAVSVGFKADITVFDSEKLADRATYNEPFRRPEGIVHVIINGVPALLSGEPTGTSPGRVLRGGG